MCLESCGVAQAEVKSFTKHLPTMLCKGVCVLQQVRYKLYVGLRISGCIGVISLPCLIPEF